MSKINKREYLDERKIYKIPHWSIDVLMKQIFLLGGTRRTYYLSLDSYCQTDDFPKEVDICDAISMARQEIRGCILYFGNGIGNTIYIILTGIMLIIGFFGIYKQRIGNI